MSDATTVMEEEAAPPTPPVRRKVDRASFTVLRSDFETPRRTDPFRVDTIAPGSASSRRSGSQTSEQQRPPVPGRRGPAPRHHRLPWLRLPPRRADPGKGRFGIDAGTDQKARREEKDVDHQPSPLGRRHASGRSPSHIAARPQEHRANRNPSEAAAADAAPGCRHAATCAPSAGNPSPGAPHRDAARGASSRASHRCRLGRKRPPRSVLLPRKPPRHPWNTTRKLPPSQLPPAAAPQTPANVPHHSDTIDGEG